MAQCSEGFYRPTGCVSPSVANEYMHISHHTVHATGQLTLHALYDTCLLSDSARHSARPSRVLGMRGWGVGWGGVGGRLTPS